MSVTQIDMFGNLIEVHNGPIELPKAKTKGKVVVSDNIQTPDNSQHFLLNGEVELLYPGGSKSKFNLNLDVIKLIKNLPPGGLNREQKLTLMRYSGWGSLSEDAFGDKKGFSPQREQLQALLTNQEYDLARASTINAHYTDPVVVEFMWKNILGMGFDKGHILEPAIGPGVFFALAPEQMVKDCWFYASEKDPITAAIAQQLYPQADIRALPLEQAGWQEGQFDLVLGNWPFGNVKVHDAALFDKLPQARSITLHDYFWLKTLLLTRPGGLVIGITSRFTLDKKDAKIRRLLAQHGKLLWAVRLPVMTFKKVAGTEVTTDILCFQAGESDDDPDWLEVENDYNVYFQRHPEYLLGEMVAFGGRYTADILECVAPETQSLSDALGNLDVISHNIYKARQIEKKRYFTSNHLTPNYLDVRNTSWDALHIRDWSYVLGNDWAIHRKIPGQGFKKQSQLGPIPTRRIRGMIEIRDAAYEVLRLNQDYAPLTTLSQAQQVLTKLYERFVSDNGPLNGRANTIALSGNDTTPGDPDLPFLLALENYDAENDKATPGDLFTERVIRKVQLPDKVDTAHEALLVSLAQWGRIDWEMMETLTGMPQEGLLDALNTEVFVNPETGNFEIASTYLAGNVKAKLDAAMVDPEKYQANIAALEKVRPEPLEFSQIETPLGAGWIPAEVYEKFVRGLLNDRCLHCVYLPEVGRWSVSYNAYDSDWRWKDFKTGVANAQTFGTSRMNGFELFQLAMNGLKPKIYDTVEDSDGNKSRVFNPKETLVAEEKQALIQQKWQEWLGEQGELQLELARLYNDRFNVFAPPSYDGSHLKPVGLTPSIHPYPHQLDDVWGIILGVANQSHNTGLFHMVGAGKTLLMIITSMELKRMGLVTKPLHIVQKSTLTGYEREFRKAYPAARILAMDTNSLTPRRRKRTLNQIATGNYDAIIITHDAFGKIPLGRSVWLRYMADRLNALDRTIALLKEENQGDKGGYTVKQIEKKRANLLAKLDAMQSDVERHTDDIMTWEKLGVDILFADEMHRYKNLFVDTSAANVPGVSTTESQRALDFYLKTRELTENCRLVGATATPLTNSICEVFTLQRYFQPDTLEQQGLGHFDAWRMLFGKIVSSIELDPTGQNFRIHDRFKEFHNVPELLQLFWQFARVRLDPKKLGLKRPKANYHQVIVEPTELQSDFFAECVTRAENIDPKALDEDNILKIISDASLVSLHPGLYDPEWRNESGKVDQCIEKVAELYHQTTGRIINDKAYNLTQFIFSDLGTPGPGKDFDVYTYIKNGLIERGIPARQIAFIQEGKNKKQRAELLKKMNDGQIRVLIGGSDSLGTGVNAQRLAIAAHLLTVPWVPALDEQSVGRVIRPGNLNPEVEIFRYLTETSLDGYRLQLCENKKTFINQFLNGTLSERTIEDISENTMSYAEMKAAVSGDPMVLEQVTAQNELQRLKTLWTEHQRNLRTVKGKMSSLAESIDLAQTRLEVFTQAQEALQAIDLETECATLGQSLWPLIQQSPYINGNIEASPTKYQVAEIAGFPIYHYAEEGMVSVDGQWRVMVRHNVAVQFGPKIARLSRFSQDKRNHARKNADTLRELLDLDELVANIKQAIAQERQQLDLLRAEEKKSFQHVDRIYELEQRLEEIRKKLEANQLTAAMPNQLAEV